MLRKLALSAFPLLLLTPTVRAGAVHTWAGPPPVETPQRGVTGSEHGGGPIHTARPTWCLSSPLYCDLLDRVLPIPAPPPGWANTWHWWGSVRIFTHEEKFGEIVCTLRVPHDTKADVTLDASASVKNLHGALMDLQLSGSTASADELARTAAIVTVSVEAADEPRLRRLASRLARLELPPVRPAVTAVDPPRYELWVDNASGDSIFASSLLPDPKLKAWMIDLKALVVERLERAERGR